MKYIQLLSLLILSIFFVCCEDMDDTFSKNIPRGKERYVGKCGNISVETGWKRFKLTWENSIDPTIKNIKVSWKSRTLEGDTLLPGGTTSFETEAIFKNENYEFKVSAIDINGKESLALNTYAKPFTEESELIKVYQIIQEKYYIVKDNLILFLYKSEGGTKQMSEVMLRYYEGETLVEREITKEEFDNQILRIQNVNVDKDITLQSKVKIQECMDTIYYEPYKLDKNSKSYMPDFLGNFAYSMDKREVTHEDLINKEELYIDYDVLSLEDIMNLPNLKHLYLCKNRYSYKKHIYPGAYSDLSYRWSTMISELERSAYAIKLMKELTGLQVHLYGDHFKKVVKYLSYGRWRDKYVRLTDHLSSSDYIYVPENTFPYVNYCNTTGWTVTANYPCDDNGPFENMFDKSDKTFWKPRELSSGSPRKHDVCIDMKKPTNMAGIVFTQADTYSSKKYLVKSIEIYYSDDKETWNSVYDTHNDIRINCSPGEKTKIDFNKNITARYVKFKVMDVDIPKYNKYVFVGMFHPYGNR